MRALDSGLRRQLERAVVEGRRVVSTGCRAALAGLGVEQSPRPAHLDEAQAKLRRGLRAKQRQLGGSFDVLVDECAYEQWHRLLFARFLAERGLLRHPRYGAPVTLTECDELASEFDEPDGWSVAARFAAQILPGTFRLDDPCVQLRLAPESRLALQRVVTGLPAEVFQADDALGWVYQYWQSERKAEVNTSERKIGGADLGPVTQLFTENYMVRFLLESSLGAWWAARHPDSPLVKDYEFLRFDDDGNPAAGGFDGWPESAAEVTVMDPCCGSGHFLVEAFGMLWRIRAEEGSLTDVAAQDAVLRDNLFGLELDPRCVQIAMFALALQAWKDGNGWRQLPIPNVACSGIAAKLPLAEWTKVAKGDARLEAALERLHTLFKDADTLGSLIDPRRAAELAEASGQIGIGAVDFEEIAPLLEKAAARETNDPATAVLGAAAASIARAAHLLSRRYTIVMTNPPFLARIKQGEVLVQDVDRHHSAGRNDLAAAFLARCTNLCMPHTNACLVIPDKLLYLGAYRQLRISLLKHSTFRLVALIGVKGFQTPMFDLGVALISIAQTPPAINAVILGCDVSTFSYPYKAEGLITASLNSVEQFTIINNRDARISFHLTGTADLLSEYALSAQGICTGDIQRFGRYFWEIPFVDGLEWVRQQSTVSQSEQWGGREHVLNWGRGRGDLHESIRQRLGPGREGAWLRGLEHLGRKGVVISQTGDLNATLYAGDYLDNNAAVVVPRSPDLLEPLWAYCSSDEYCKNVRAIDSALKITNLTLLKVPFNVERWRRVAEEAGPLPDPWSHDPTQWLFEGRPEVATEPLQVVVGRLLGYRWPEQGEKDDLEELADADGIVCLPSVRGEPEAAARLEQVLARAFGAAWGPGKRRELLEAAGSKETGLYAWLRDEFFKHHCKVFGQRPFIWHLWDGRKDGFGALVNYHRMDRPMLNKLTYTYLGDWIERQRAQFAADVPGADVRLAAATQLRGKLERIIGGEDPFDIFVRWKGLHEQPIGWEPDLDDGVRLNIRPFVTANVLRAKVGVHWRKDRGRNPDGSERHNDIHHKLAVKRAARQQAGRA